MASIDSLFSFIDCFVAWHPNCLQIPHAACCLLLLLFISFQHVSPRARVKIPQDASKTCFYSLVLRSLLGRKKVGAHSNLQQIRLGRGCQDMTFFDGLHLPQPMHRRKQQFNEMKISVGIFSRYIGCTCINFNYIHTTCTYVYIRIYDFIYVGMYACMCVCMFVYMLVWLRMYIGYWIVISFHSKHLVFSWVYFVPELP